MTTRPSPATPGAVDGLPPESENGAPAANGWRERTTTTWTADLVVLSALLALTALFGRPFSKLGIPAANLYVTEVAIAAVAALALWRCGLRGAVERARAMLPVVPLLLLWLAGAVAAVRGLEEFGLSLVVRDVGLVEYSVFIPLIAVVVDSRAKAAALVRVLLLAGAGATLVFAVVAHFANDTALGSAENPGAAVGLYMSLFVLLAAARVAHRRPVGRLEIVLGAGALVLMSLMVVRSVVLALVVSLAALVVLSPPRRRLFTAALAASCLAISIGGAALVEQLAPGGSEVAPPPPSAVADPDFVADDGLSAMYGGLAVTGDARTGRFAREIRIGEVLELPAVTGLRPGMPYEVVFAVKPLAARLTQGRVGDTSGAGWSAEPWGAKANRTWQRVEAVLTATRPAERLVIIVDSGAARVRVDAVRVLQGRTRAEGQRPAAPRGEADEQAPPPAPSSGADETDDAAPSPEAEGAEPAEPPEPEPAEPPPPPSDVKPGLFVAAEETFNEESGSGFASNMRWRLAIWRFMLAETASQPILGVGFGKPTAFRWHGVTYDARRGDPQDLNDVTGPHNSFVNLLFRTGLLGFLPFLVLVAIAGARVFSWLRGSHAAEERAHVVGLAAIFVFAAVVVSFNVALEGPFMGMFFWVVLGLLLVVPRLYGSGAAGARRAER